MDFSTDFTVKHPDVPSSRVSQWRSVFLGWICTLWWFLASQPPRSTCHHLGSPLCAARTWIQCRCSSWSIQLWWAGEWRWRWRSLLQHTNRQNVMIRLLWRAVCMQNRKFREWKGRVCGIIIANLCSMQQSGKTLIFTWYDLLSLTTE